MSDVIPVRGEYNPELQGPYLFDYVSWGMQEVGAPPILERRNYQSIYRYVRHYAVADADVRMTVGLSNNSMVFYQGDKMWNLQEAAK